MVLKKTHFLSLNLFSSLMTQMWIVIDFFSVLSCLFFSPKLSVASLSSIKFYVSGITEFMNSNNMFFMFSSKDLKLPLVLLHKAGGISWNNFTSHCCEIIDSIHENWSSLNCFQVTIIIVLREEIWRSLCKCNQESSLNPNQFSTYQSNL